MEASQGLSRRERQIMNVLHQRSRATVAEVMDAMPDPPSYSAVRATLRILEEKGHVVHEENGPRYVYRPTVAPEAAKEAALKHVVRTFFGGSAEQAAVALLGMAETELTDADIQRLTRMIREAAQEGR